MANTPLPPLEFLRECFDYDPETGAFRWRHRPSRHFHDDDTARRWNERYAGTEALGHDCQGHLKGEVRHEGRRFRLFAHRVAFKLMTGRDPTEQIDHQNGNKADNRWPNLREATASGNMRNRKQRQTGLPKCVFYDKGRFQTKSYDANGQRVYLGRYDTPKEAHAAYVAFAKPIHGEFFNAGAPVESVFD